MKAPLDPFFEGLAGGPLGSVQPSSSSSRSQRGSADWTTLSIPSMQISLTNARRNASSSAHPRQQLVVTRRLALGAEPG